MVYRVSVSGVWVGVVAVIKPIQQGLATASYAHVFTTVEDFDDMCWRSMERLEVIENENDALTKLSLIAWWERQRVVVAAQIRERL